MELLERTLRLSQDHINFARQELTRTNLFLSRKDSEMREMRNMQQRIQLLGASDFSLNLGNRLFDYLDNEDSLRNSRNILSCHLSFALSFITEALCVIAENREQNVPAFSYLQRIRSALGDIRYILTDYKYKQIPMDGVASTIARAESIARKGALTRMTESGKYAEIRDVLKSIRQSIASR